MPIIVVKYMHTHRLANLVMFALINSKISQCLGGGLVEYQMNTKEYKIESGAKVHKTNADQKSLGP